MSEGAAGRIVRRHTNERLAQSVSCAPFVFLSGQVARETLGEGVEAQTREILARIDTLLEEAGSDKGHIVQATIWVADVADIPRMNAEWEAWIPSGAVPARATVQAVLARPAYRIEIALTAVSSRAPTEAVAGPGTS